MSEPIITPAKFRANRVLREELAGCTTAVLAFCRFGAMREKLGATPLPERCFSHIDEAHQFAARAGGHPVVAVDCLYGGPMAATVLEELAYYGIRHVVAYGWAGSLTREVPIGTALLASEALVSDGTSREYRPQGGIVGPDAGVCAALREEMERLGLAPRPGCIWTTDAIYREYPEKVAAWRQAGADAVNMDTSYLYTISDVVSLASAYACIISDCVEGPVWDEGFARAREAMGLLQDAAVATAARLAAM